MSGNNDDRSLFDPTGLLRGMRDANAAALTQMLSSEEYARATGALLDSYLQSSAPFRKMIEQMLLQFVQSEAYAEAMRSAFDTYMAGAAPLRAMLAELMASDRYIEATRAMLDTYLRTSEPLREALVAAMRQAFAGAGRAKLPSFAGWLDPTGMFASMREASVNAWASQPPAATIQQVIEQSMTQALIQLNMPTRTDVISIGEQLSLLEERLGEIESRLGTLAGNPPKPARARSRTRKASQS